MKYDDIFTEYPHKKAPDSKEMALTRRADNAHRRMLVDAREIKKVTADISEGEE